METRYYILLMALFSGYWGLVAQPVNNLTGDVVVTPPNASSIGKYTDMPVDLSTGVPQIEFPIHTLVEGSLSVPVSLAYHASGIRVLETPSWVGTGWTLFAGGSISRTALGLPDEHNNGFYFTGATLNSSTPISQSTSQAIANDLQDGEPDQFSFNIPGYSGHFYIDYLHKPILVPQQDLVVKFNGNNSINGSDLPENRFNAFTITTPDGTIYHFGNAPGDTDDGIEKMFLTSSHLYPVTWHLMKIESADHLFKVDFTYDPETYGYASSSTARKMFLYYGSYFFNQPDYFANTGTIVLLYGKRLKLIKTTTEQIRFDAVNDREDVDNIYGSKSKRLDKIFLETAVTPIFCKRWDFNYDYFKAVPTPTLFAEKRLKLLSVQEVSCDGTIVIPATAFEYEGTFLPSMFSLKYDHWGYYNNAGDGIPPTTLSAPSPAPTITFGSGNRETVETEMLKGVLKKITYPTGGNTSFVFEANDCKSTSTSPTVVLEINAPSCHITNITSSIITFNSTQLANRTYSVSHIPVASCSENNPATNNFTLELWKQSGNILVATYTFNSDSYYSSTGNIITLFPQLLANTNYYFVLKPSKAVQNFKIIDPPSTYYNRKVGGLRIKTVVTSDGVNPNNNIIKNYSYLGIDGFSSGVLYREPVYGLLASGIGYISGNNGGLGWNNIIYPTVYHWSSSPISPISSFNGRHLVYGRVAEAENNNGTSILKFQTSDNSPQPNTGFPYIPETIKLVSGRMIESQVNSQAGSPISLEKKTYAGNYVPGNDTYVRVFGFNISGYIDDSGFTGACYFNSTWGDYSGYTLMKKLEYTRDGVYTKTGFKYNADPITYQFGPEADTTWNSDGSTYINEYEYIFNYSDATIKQRLINANIIVSPYKTRLKVNGTNIDGNEVEYAFYNLATGVRQASSTGAFPRPYNIKRLEATWDVNGNLFNPNTVIRSTIDSYDAYGNIKSLTRKGWNSILYEWEPSGMIKKKTFGNQETLYSYHPGTRLLKYIRQYDGQESWYDYDNDWRLGKKWKMPSTAGSKASANETLEYTYQYKDATYPKSFIKEKKTFTPVAGSGVNVQELYSYFDELGRKIQVVGKQYSPNQKDVLLETIEYDASDRILRSYIPYEVTTNTTGAYYSIPGGSPHTLFAYEASPLDRKSSVTPPSWYATTYSYGTNSSEVLMNGTSTPYPANVLFRETVTDPEGQQKMTYTDILGRLVCSRDFEIPLDAKTHTVYDPKGRVKLIIPPGASSTDAGLIYKFVYDGADNLTYRKFPDMDAVTMSYNDRDLLSYLQDGNLALQSKYLATQYDTYGREVKQGFSSNIAFPNPTFTEVIKENFYDGFDGVVQVINLVSNPQYIGRLYKGKTKVLGSSNDWISTTYNYDPYGRNTSSVGNNHLTPTSTNSEQNSFTFDYAGNELTRNRTHTYNSISTTYNQRRTFDSWSRLADYYTSLNGTEKLTSRYSYNARDLLTEINLHNDVYAGTNAWLQSVDYTYNNQGWLERINNSTLGGTNIGLPGGCSGSLPNPGTTLITDPIDNKDLFYYENKYDVLESGLTGTIQKNGNISQVLWRTRGRFRQTYSYTYDELNRLKTGTYREMNDSGTITVSNTYNTSYSYADLRGNFSALSRSGYYLNADCWTQGTLDNLSYTYQSGTNKLTSNSETGLSTQGGFKATSGTYTYDVNGNTKTDGSKGITNITYNFLNLPTLIDFGSGKSIELTYDADGRKLKKVVKNTGGTIAYTQHYIDGIEYRDNSIEAIYHKEGRFYNASGSYRREYYIRDHLGNVRLTFSDLNNNGVIATPGEILQETHYDPFGWRLEGAYINHAAPDNMYQYNEKENNTDHGLNLLDYGVRWYNPAIGRFTGVDPFADKFAWVTTYNYAENDPISNVDLWGLQAVSAGIASDMRLLEVQRNTGFKILSGLDKALNYIGTKMNNIFNEFLPEGTPNPENYRNSGNTIGEGIQQVTNSTNNGNNTLGTSFSEKAASLIVVDEMLFPNGSGALDYAVKDAPLFIRFMDGARQSAENADKASAYIFAGPAKRNGIDTIKANGIPVAVRETMYRKDGVIETHTIPIKRKEE